MKSISQMTQTIYDALTRQTFADWYGEGGAFDRHIRGEENSPIKSAIEEDIVRIFRLKDEPAKKAQLRPIHVKGWIGLSNLPDGMYDVALGNGTRLDVAIMNTDRGCYIGVEGKSGYRFRSSHDASYIAEKLNLPLGDAQNMADFISALFDEEGNKQGTYQKICCQNFH